MSVWSSRGLQTLCEARSDQLMGAVLRGHSHCSVSPGATEQNEGDMSILAWGPETSRSCTRWSRATVGLFFVFYFLINYFLGTEMPQWACGGERATCWFSPSIPWIQELNSDHQAWWQAPLFSSERSRSFQMVVPGQTDPQNLFFVTAA